MILIHQSLMAKHWQKVCGWWSLQRHETLTFSSCISILFILWEKHRAGVRGAKDHRRVLLGSYSNLHSQPKSDWLQLTGQFGLLLSCLSDWFTIWLSVRLCCWLAYWLPVSLIACLTVCPFVCLTGRFAGGVCLEALMFCWLRSFLTWTHKGFWTQTEVCCYTTPSSLHAKGVICNILEVHTSTQSSLSDVCRLWFSWSAFWHSSIELFSTYTGIHADHRQTDETHMQIFIVYN